MTQFTGQLWVPPLAVAVQQQGWRTIYGGRCRVSLSRRLSPSNIPIGCVLAPRFLHPLRGEKPGPVHSSFRGRDRRLTDGDNYFNATRSAKSGCGWLLHPGRSRHAAWLLAAERQSRGPVAIDLAISAGTFGDDNSSFAQTTNVPPANCHRAIFRVTAVVR